METNLKKEPGILLVAMSLSKTSSQNLFLLCCSTMYPYFFCFFRKKCPAVTITLYRLRAYIELEICIAGWGYFMLVLYAFILN